MNEQTDASHKADDELDQLINDSIEKALESTSAGNACPSTPDQSSIPPMFHEHYPDGCPPPDAPPASGQYYRLVNVPPSEADLKSQFEEGKGKSCEERGVSLYDTIKGIKRLIESYPVHSHKKIALISLDPSWGVMHIGKNRGGYRHVNFWLYRNAPRPEIASRLELVEGDAS